MHDIPISNATMQVPVIATLLYGPEGGIMSAVNERIRQMMLRINPAHNIFLLLLVFMSDYYLLVYQSVCLR
jgi:hypothetical protein